MPFDHDDMTGFKILLWSFVFGVCFMIGLIILTAVGFEVPIVDRGLSEDQSPFPIPRP
jgi:hypothetical protein